MAMSLLQAECTSCGSSLIKIKLFNKWSFDKNIVYGATFGVAVTLTGCVVYKLWRFNRNLKKSIDEITNLNRRLEYIILDLTHIDEARIGQTEQLLDKTSKKSIVKSKNSLPSRTSTSASSVATMSDAYETPNTSPPSSSLESDDEEDTYVDDGGDVDEEFKDPIEELSDTNSQRSSRSSSFSDMSKIVPLKSVLKKRKQDDDYHRLLSLPIDDLKRVVDKTEDQYRQNESNLDKLIDYIKVLVVFAERIDAPVDEIKEIQYKCYNLARKSVELNDQIFTTHKWLAITVGTIIEYMSINEKIKSSLDFKKHLDIALELNNNDYYLLYMRGRFIYKLCNLNWAEKYGVKLIYGQLPPFNIENALNDFLKVEELYPKKLKGNLLYIAKCYISLLNLKKGVEYLNEAIKLPTNTRQDELENQEIMSLIQKYSQI